MPTILEKILAKSGKTILDVPSNTKIGKLVRRKGVNNSPELERIKALPRRRWEDDPDLEELIDLMTDWLKTTGGTMRLLPQQAQALREAMDLGSIMAPFPVGEGKTLLSNLLPTALEAKRPILFLPKKLIKKTEREFALLAKHWRAPANLRIESIELLSSPKTGPTLLEKYLPDLILADEAHRFKNLKAACTKRLRRHVDNYDCKYIPMSGTFWDSSIMDAHHQFAWSLPKELQPLPTDWRELRDWASAIDEKVKQRLAPGALMTLCEPGESKDLAGVRKAIGRRLTETPGVVSVNSSGVKCSLSIEADLFDGYNKETEEAFRTLNKWKTPDEWEIQDSIVKWGHEYQEALGFFYRCNPRPPQWWLQPKQEWSKWCRYTTQHNHRNLDSELMVAQACARGLYPGSPYAAWKAVKDKFKPNQEAIWIDDSFLKHCAEWLEKERGVMWAGHIEFATKLSELTGYPYFGPQGMDNKGRSIETYKGGPIIASIAANSEGRNLQDRWSSCYVPAPMGTSKAWEQLLGRFHRQGQKADTVSCAVLVSCLSHFNSLTMARNRAEFVTSTAKQDRKLLLADWLVPTTTEVSRLKGARWERSTKPEA